jgi:RNA polymerase sigma factor (sigma-70 family)
MQSRSDGETPSRLTGELARAAQSGDAARFGELYERIAPSLFAWADLRIRADLRTWIEPQDVVQEVWYRAWKSFPSYAAADHGSFRYWIFRIAKNILLEAFRELRAPAFKAANAGSTSRLVALHEVADETRAITRRVAQMEALKLFSRWVAELDEDDRRLIVHCGLEGMSHAEVATRLSISEAAVSKRWQRLQARMESSREPRELFLAVE